MAIEINDNLSVKAPRNIDTRYSKLSGGVSVPYASLAEALTSIPASYRCRGLSFIALLSGVQTEYWFKTGISDGDVFIKAPNLATVATTGQYADLLSKPTIPTTTSQLTNNSGFLTAAILSVTGTANQVNITGGSSPTFSLPQDIATSSSPVFKQLTLSGAFNDSSSVNILAIQSAFNVQADGITQTALSVYPTFTDTFTGIQAFTYTTGVSGYTVGTFGNIGVTGGTGTGAKFLVTVNGDGTIDSLTGVVVTNVGTGYTASDVLTLAAGGYGGTTIHVTVSSIGHRFGLNLGLDIGNGAQLRVNGSFLYATGNNAGFSQYASHAGDRNSFFGIQSGNLSKGTANSAFGFGSLINLSVGNYNTAVGDHAGFGISLSGNYNTAIGFSALGAADTGIAHIVGDYNTAMGAHALSNLGVAATKNTTLGYKAGYALSTGSRNIIIGDNLDTDTGADNDRLLIGSNGVRWIVGNAGTISIPNLAGVGERVVTVDAAGSFLATSPINDTFVTDTDVITAITGATYNVGNSYTAVIAPASLKVFNQSQMYKSGAYLYIAISDNASSRIPLG